MNDMEKMRFFESVDPVLVDELLGHWQSICPKMGICAFLPEADKHQVSLLQRVCAQRHVPLLGAIFPALIHQAAFHAHGIWLMRLDEMPFYALHANLPTEPDDLELHCQQLTQPIVEQLAPGQEYTLFMLFDAMVPLIGSMLDGIYLQLANRVHYAGANAGSETFAPMACLFDGQRLVQNAVLLVLLPMHKGAILEHGYLAPAQTVYATSTSGNCISQIDWQSAFEVYQALVREQYGVQITPENFYQNAVHFPFGIVRANHHVVVRIPVLLKEDGSLFCVGEVPANSVLTLLQRPVVDSIETLRVLSDGLTRLKGDSVGAELLLFYCAGRRMHLGDGRALGELQAFDSMTRSGQVAGAVSLGEIGGSTLHGYPLFHNASLLAAHW